MLARAAPRQARAAAEAIIAAGDASHVEALIVALRTVGWADRVLFAHASARTALDRAARLARRHQLSRRLAEVLVTRAGLRLEYGTFAAAARDLAAARVALNGEPLAELEAQAGVMAAKRGELARAVAHLERARTELPAADQSLRFVVHNNLGMALVLMGRGDAAEQVLKDGLAAAAAVGPLAHGTIWQTFALAAVKAGRLPEALQRFDRAAELIRGTDWPVGEAYLERIDAYANLRLVAEAEHAAQRALRELRGAGGAMLRADALLQHAKVLVWDGRLHDALASAREAAELYRMQRRSVLRAAADGVAVEIEHRLGAGGPDLARRAGRAANTLERAGLLAEAVDALLVSADVAGARGATGARRRALQRAAALAARGPALVRLRGHIARARLAATPAATRRAARRGLDELARFRATLPTLELRALASGHGVELAVMGMRSALTDGAPRRLFEWMERGRLASALISAPVAHDEVVDVELARLREIQTQVLGADDPEARAALVARQTRVEARIQDRLRRGGIVTRDPAHIVTGTAVVDALAADAALVAMVELDEQVVAVSLAGRAKALTLGDVRLPRRCLEEVMFGLRRLLRSRSEAGRVSARLGVDASLTELDRLVGAPIRAAVADREQLVIVPPSSLLGVPWHALPSLADRAVTLAPSATLWLRARDGRRAGHAPLLVAGPGLEGAEPEVRLIERHQRGATVLVGAAATPDRVIAAMEDASVAHLACHGRFRADSPTFSSVRLAGGDLTVLDLERMRRTPDVLVMAACDIGATKTLPGEELRGFLTSAMMLGTRAVVASCVPVGDISTKSLMGELHRHVAAGNGLGRSLHMARAASDASDPQALVGRIAFACYGDADAAVVADPV